VLVVGTPGEVVVSTDGRVTLNAVAQAAHPLGESWRWAHVHEVDGIHVARILCARDLVRETYYTACVVPAFVVDADGAVHDAWPVAGGGAVTLPCYDAWSFRTGPEGDFPQLAAKLRAADTARLAQKAFGRAQVRYDRRGPGDPARATLSTAGALQTPAPPTPQAVDAWIATEVAALVEPLPTPDGRWVLTSPRYPEPFVAPGATPTAGGWSQAMTEDPRVRGAAGLGAWAAIAWQDDIARAAATKAGDLAIARERVGALALGVEASRSLWRRHVPSDPVERLAVLERAGDRKP